MRDDTGLGETPHSDSGPDLRRLPDGSGEVAKRLYGRRAVRTGPMPTGILPCTAGSRGVCCLFFGI